MKINLLLLFFSVSFLFNTPTILAQKKKPSAKGIKTAKNLITELEFMIDKPKYSGKNHPCNPLNYLKKLDKKKLLPDQKGLALKMDSLHDLLTNYKELYITDPVIQIPILAFTDSKNYSDFISRLYKKSTGLIASKEKSAFYRSLKNLKKNGILLEEKTHTIGVCTYEITSKFEIATWTTKYIETSSEYQSFMDGTLSTKVRISCNCKGKSTTDLKKAIFKYHMPIQAIIQIERFTDKDKISFKQEKKGKNLLDLIQANCCTTSDISFEDPALEISPTENISLPSQTIGAFGGVGFSQDFEETTLCIGGEYLYNITDLGNNPLFVGANVLLETTNFMDVSNTWVGVGPTAQLFSPISPSGETQLTNGVGANFIFGSNDNGISKDNLTGFEISINTGLNVQLNQNTSVALILPVLQYQNLTFEAENGGATFEQSSTSLFFGKGSSTKLGLRFGF